MHLIDPQDAFTMAAVDPAALGELADIAITLVHGPTWNTEEAHDEHGYHDEPDMHQECAHCRIHRHFHGQGYNIAKAQYAMSILPTLDHGRGF